MSAPRQNALDLLSAYSSSDSEDEVVPCNVKLKRAAAEEGKDEHFTSTTKRIKKNEESTAAFKFAVPDMVQSMFERKEDEAQEDPSIHGGRIRSFPHERGNWATYVFVPFESNPVVSSLVQVCIESCLPALAMSVVDDFHISVTRTVVLRHHWIDTFTSSVRQALISLSRFTCWLQSLEVYTNEEDTRTFLGLRVQTGHAEMLEIVKRLDKCLDEFKLLPFYQDPSFHMSIASCVGNKVQELEEMLPQLQLIISHFQEVQPDCFTVEVQELFCKSGNKVFSFKLAGG